jgi:hypothetical protein
VRLARVGDAHLLERAVVAASDLDDLLDPLVASGAALHEAQANRSRDSLRTWSPVATAVTRPSGNVVWWVRGEVVKPSNQDDLTWSLEVASTRDGPWTIAATGEHDPDGNGTVSLQVTDMADSLGEENPLGELTMSYNDKRGPGTERTAEYEVQDVLASQRYWHVTSQTTIVWDGSFALTEDGREWPGTAQVFHDDKDGGRAMGLLYKEAGVPLVFEACWDSKGDNVWTTGADDIRESGSEDACQTPELN